jgi:hypothetical protein
MLKYIRGIAGTVLLAVAFSLAGCEKGALDDLVTVKYRQPVNFYVFDKCPACSPHQTVDAADGMFMVYCVVSVTNTGKGAVDFLFDLGKLYASDYSQVSGNTSLDSYLKTASNMTVPKGTTKSSIGRIVIHVSGDPNSMKTVNQPLHYHSAGAESVLVVADSTQQPQYGATFTPDDVSTNPLLQCP